MTVAAYQPPQSFRAWAVASGYATPMLFQLTGPHVRVPVDLYDIDRDGAVTTVARWSTTRCASGSQYMSESRYWDLDRDGFVSDDERDEDSDGLINYHEVTGPMTPGLLEGLLPERG